jgi:hypothetical protein
MLEKGKEKVPHPYLIPHARIILKCITDLNITDLNARVKEF